MRLVVRSLSKRFGSRTLFEDLSFEAESGLMVAIMGPSGSGKSTLLSLIGGLSVPATGEIQMRPVQRHNAVAWMFQTANVLPSRTALDNAALGGYRAGMGISESRVAAGEALSEVGLAAQKRQLVRELSGGERQRVVVAAGLVGRPSLLIADEPTAQLDRANGLIVLDALRRVAQAGAIVLVATHDTTMARRCDRTIALGKNVHAR